VFVLLKHREHVFSRPEVSNEHRWFVIPCTHKRKGVYENVLVAIIALAQEEDDVNVSGGVNASDQVELGVQ
jgi:hypothetical protein